MNTNATDIDAYLAGLPDDARTTLGALRRVIRSAAPEAAESISYGMPTFKYKGRHLIYFAAAKNHLALYGTSQGTIRFTPSDPPAEILVQNLLRERMDAIEAAPTKRKKM